MIPANVSLGALLDENKQLRAENADLRADVEAFRPLWSSPFARPERWTTEPNPHPRSYVSTQQAQQDYADSIRCSSDWPPEKRHEAMDRALGRIPDLAYEIEYLRAELEHAADPEIERIIDMETEREGLRSSNAEGWREASQRLAEVERLRAELARRDQQISAVRALANDARIGYHPISDVSALDILRALDGAS